MIGEESASRLGLVSNRIQHSTERNGCRTRSLALIGALLLGAPVLAQTIQTDGSGSVRVVVHDVTDLPIEGATVTLTCRDGSTTIRATNDRGEAMFDRAPAGSCQGVVESIGFTSSAIEPFFGFGAAARVTRQVILQVAGFVEQLEVKADNDRLGDSFTRQLTADQLAALPEDPQELEAILRQLAGDGADIRVNGFSGGRLPLGSRIQDVRIRDDVGAGIERWWAEGGNSDDTQRRMAEQRQHARRGLSPECAQRVLRRTSGWANTRLPVAARWPSRARPHVAVGKHRWFEINRKPDDACRRSPAAPVPTSSASRRIGIGIWTRVEHVNQPVADAARGFLEEFE
jgi:hypothetical protein